jgi:hypothetical protein
MGSCSKGSVGGPQQAAGPACGQMPAQQRTALIAELRVPDICAALLLPSRCASLLLQHHHRGDHSQCPSPQEVRPACLGCGPDCPECRDLCCCHGSHCVEVCQGAQEAPGRRGRGSQRAPVPSVRPQHPLACEQQLQRRMRCGDVWFWTGCHVSWLAGSGSLLSAGSSPA